MKFGKVLSTAYGTRGKIGPNEIRERLTTVCGTRAQMVLNLIRRHRSLLVVPDPNRSQIVFWEVLALVCGPRTKTRVKCEGGGPRVVAHAPKSGQMRCGRG